MTDYDTLYAMLSRTTKEMGQFAPVLSQEKNLSEDILILHENGSEVWYYFDNKGHALTCVRVYGK
jgi:hypothetical protein